jgi:hypothetical protein
MTIEITQRPLYLTARNHVYDAWDMRNAMEHPSQGAGVIDRESFRVMQRQAGANLSVDIGVTGVTRMRAWVRGSIRGGQGLYLVDNIDRSFPGVDVYLPQLNHVVAANSSGLPRIDGVYLKVLDQQHAGGSNDAVIDIVAGTPTAGATKLNRAGAAATPPNALWLSDLVVPSGATSPSEIIDHRHVCGLGRLPVGLLPGALTYDCLVPRPVSVFPVPGTQVTYNSTLNGVTCAAAFEVRSRFKSTGIRWGFQQGTPATTLVTGNYFWQVFDSAGWNIINTPQGTIAGAGGQSQYAVADAWAGGVTVTYEPGIYWFAFSFRNLSRGNTTSAAYLQFQGYQYIPGILGGMLYQLASPGYATQLDVGTTFTDAASVSPGLPPLAPGPVVPSFALVG